MDFQLASQDVLSRFSVDALMLPAGNDYQRLVVTGDGNPVSVAVLEKVTADNLLSVPVVDPDEASAAVAGLWLLHDWLDRSHDLAGH